MKLTLDVSQFELDEIVSIELCGEEDTVDITVEDTHMFYANDIYTHNSSIQDDVIEADKISESYQKIMTADVVISLSRKLEDKANFTGRAHVIKNRFGIDGITLPMHINTGQGKIEIFDENSSQGMLLKKQMSGADSKMKKSLAEKFAQLKDDFLDD